VRADRISPLTIRRLSLYLRRLEELAQQGRKTVSSRQLGKALGLTDAQVRKDLAYFGQFGRPGVGYAVEEMVTRLRQIFGTQKVWDVAVVGAGNIGRALLAFKGFPPRGFRMAAAFDNDSAKIGRKTSGVLVQPISRLTSTIRKRHIRVAVLAVPAGSAQEVAEALCQAGVKGILNFAPVRLNVPEDVAVVPVDLASVLQQLSYFVTAARGENESDPRLTGNLT
jgi:redox-sensing transcriptional repressor